MHLFVKGLKGLVQDVLENAKDLPRMRNSICKIKDVLRYVCESHYISIPFIPFIITPLPYVQYTYVHRIVHVLHTIHHTPNTRL